MRIEMQPTVDEWAEYEDPLVRTAHKMFRALIEECPNKPDLLIITTMYFTYGFLKTMADRTDSCLEEVIEQYLRRLEQFLCDE